MIEVDFSFPLVKEMKRGFCALKPRLVIRSFLKPKNLGFQIVG